MKTITKPPVASAEHPLKPLRGLPRSARVDRERHVITGVAIAQVGPLQVGDSRPWFVDQTTVEQVVSMGSASPKGLKARWSHPNQSNDGMGSYVGRWRRFRISDDGLMAIADLHLARIAFNGGDQSRGKYIEDMAEEDPEAFGVSIFPVNDKELMASLETSDGLQPIRLRRLVAADVVDEPAATQGGFFGGRLSIATAPAHATAALDQLFADATPDVIRDRIGSFVETYLSSRFGGHSQERKEEIMADTPVTSEALNSALSTFGDKLTAGLLGRVDDKIAAALATKPPVTPVEEKPPISETEIRSAESKRCSELFALAQNAGMSDWQKAATGWIEKGLSVVEAKAAVADIAIAKNGLTTDSGANDGDADPDAKFKAEYRKNLAALSSMGVSEAEYVFSCRVDAGLSILAPAAISGQQAA